MSDPYIGEIRLLPFGFAPTGWALCQGQILSIAQNTALFSVIGTQYGGNGTSNFALPNLSGAVPIGAGQGPGLSSFSVGQTGGEATVSLSLPALPAHSHPMTAIAAPATAAAPASGLAPAEGRNQGRGSMAIRDFAPPGTGTATTLSSASVAPAGGSGPHNNMQPSLTMNWCIALSGIYPPRS